jgi:SSS family solute:Na+ symporter
MVGLTGIALFTKRYMRSVADFLAANRCAGRYLLVMADGAAAIGAVSIVAQFEKFYSAGFAAQWWMILMTPILLVISLSGWVTYRFRATRALTMAQFFEMRYSRKFRVFSGLVGFVSGVMNYAIFPAVTARFVIVFFGIPVHTANFLGLEVNLTMAAVMAASLGLALYFAFLGGQVSVMITDFIQSSLFNITFLLIVGLLLYKFGWHNIVETLQTVPEGASMLDPFKTDKANDFNAGFFLMQAAITFYGFRVWQGNAGSQSAAKSPHEAKMAGILSYWRQAVTAVLYVMVPICVFVLLHNGQYAQEARTVRAALDAIGDPQLITQMTSPMGLTQLLPVGVFGLMCAVILCSALSTDDSYLLSWGSIFVQDVLLPFRKKPLDKDAHLVWLKRAVFGVAAFAFLFSLLVPIKEYIIMWFALTSAIFIGGAGSAVIGGLYWKRGTTAGAWAGMVTGSVIAVTGVSMRQLFWEKLQPLLQSNYPDTAWIQNLPSTFPLTGMQVSFTAAMSAVLAYVAFSLLTKPDPDFDMDRLLHRGKYAIDGDVQPQHSKSRFWKALGVGNEFTRGDKAIYMFRLCWTMFWFTIVAVGTVYGMNHQISLQSWGRWWGVFIGAWVAVGVFSTIWFLIGGVRDIIILFRILHSAQRDDSDDGTVVGHGLPSDHKE